MGRALASREGIGEGGTELETNFLLVQKVW